MSDDPDLTGRVSLNLTRLVEGLRFAQAVTRRQIGNLVRDANQRLRGLDTSPLTAGLGRVVGTIGSLGRLAAPFAAAGAAIGGLVPLVAGLVATLAQIAPAAALAVSGVLAIGLASTTLKLAMSGVGDAVKAALDPSDPEAYAEALKKLSPNARSFVGEIHKASPALAAIKKSVQDKVFSGLDKQLSSTARTTLPIFRKALDSTAGTLNRMGTGVLTAARDLGKDGALGTALKGATSGLDEFSRAPGQVVTAFGQIGAAAAPAFARLSKAGAGALDKVAAKLTKSFESGGMEKAIDQAITLIGQLGRVIGNVGSVLGSVFGAAQASGGGFLGVLESVTTEIARIAKTDAVQDGLKSLFSVMSTLGSTAAPLLGQALQIIGPVLTQLAGPAEQLITLLGAQFGNILTELSPVLISLAEAGGKLVVALLPIIELAGQLITSLLPVLVPQFESFGAVFEAATPMIAQLAGILASLLLPALAQLPGFLEQVLPVFVKLAQELFPVVTEQLQRMAPAFVTLGEQIGELIVAAAPLVAQILEMALAFSATLIPIITGGVVVVLTGLAVILSGLAAIFRNVVVPAVQFLIDLFRGDFFDANSAASQAVRDLRDRAVAYLVSLKDRAGAALSGYVSALRARVSEGAASFISGVHGMADRAMAEVHSIPGRVQGALGNLGGLLVNAGASIVSGLISGIRSKIPSVQGVLSGLTAMIPNWKGPKRKDATLLTPAGKSIIKGLIDGIDSSTSALKSKLTSITNVIERAININKGNKKKVAGLSSLLARVEKDNKKLLSLAKQRDTVAAKLKAAQTKLDDALKQRSQAAAQIKAGILGDANITSGNNVVNSVSAITIGLQQAAAKAKTFAANLAKLKKAGLRTDLLDDIASAGLDGGAATAEALAKATPAELKKINELQAQLAKSAGAAGTTTASALYDAGVKAAQGLVDGLKKQQKNIEAQMEKIADAMVKAIKKKLGIHSPSRVARTIGEQFMEGMPIGFEAMRARVTRSAASVANAAATAATAVASVTPRIPAVGQLSAAYAGTAGAGPTNNTFNLYQSDATPDGILRALSWQGLIGRKGR